MNNKYCKFLTIKINISNFQQSKISNFQQSKISNFQQSKISNFQQSKLLNVYGKIKSIWNSDIIFSNTLSQHLDKFGQVKAPTIEIIYLSTNLEAKLFFDFFVF